jgi:flagellar hook protein FlgE
MDVIANNISNVNTIGFKSGRVTFSEVFSQTISGATGPNAETGRGGKNAMQVGLGANVASIDLLMKTGAAERTDNPFDIMIQGDGFFIVGDSSGDYFTRAGAFNFDRDGNIVNASGMNVMGWEAYKDNDINSNSFGKFVVRESIVKPINISGTRGYIEPEQTTAINFDGNLNPNESLTKEGTMDFYDTVGNRYVVDVIYRYIAAAVGAPGHWDISFGNYAYVNGDRTEDALEISSAPSAGGVTVTVAQNPSPANNRPPVVWGAPIATLTFDTSGFLASAAPAGTVATPGAYDMQLIIDKGSTIALTPDSDFGLNGEITLDFADMRQFANELTVARATRADGNAPGSLTGVSIGADGIVSGRYTNGVLSTLAQIPVAYFENAAGLEKEGDNLYTTSANSGDFDGVGEGVQARGGQMMGGTLEMSNVDLSAEFTSMITTQRGFQANSRVITTSDDMLQELINMKR